MLYNQLIDTIENTHNSLRKRAISSINQQLVIRNWLIGFYIVEFERFDVSTTWRGKSQIWR